jgi:hypothetical protein
MLPEKHHLEKENLYGRLLHICHFISLLTDGNALLFYKTITAAKINTCTLNLFAKPNKSISFAQ